MNRYSLKFDATDDTLAADDLKKAVEAVLLRLHPSFTYRMGRVFRAGSKSMIAENEFEGKKDFLGPHLKRIEQKLPVVLEFIGWGWDPGASPALPAPGLPQDPLAFPFPSPVRPFFTQMNYRAASRAVSKP